MAFSAFADEQFEQPSSDAGDENFAQLYGTCTRQTCPPGSAVKVVAEKNDTSTAIDADGNSYDLLRLRKIKFIVVDNDKNHSALVNVRAPGGMVYSIQRVFLKRL